MAKKTKTQEPVVENETKSRTLRSKLLAKGSFDPKTYEYDAGFRPWDGADPLGVHTTSEMLSSLRENKHIEFDAKVLHIRKAADGRLIAKPRKITKDNFIEAFQQDVGKGIRIREGFSSDGGVNGSLGSTIVGDDFTPLLGGPFYKNLYFYQDYIRMHAEAFFAYHNDPFAKAIIHITRDFVIGTGYEMVCDVDTREGKLAMAAWKAFEEANDLQNQIDHTCIEISDYGEVMLWKLPAGQSKITYRLSGADTDPIGIIPRVRLIDPSNIVEIVTYPEDITRPLFYVWLQPTQYQIYTSGLHSVGSSAAPPQPTLKYIYRQIPANEMLHYRVNCMSNEKRGRSDLFPVFNYLKRMRDAIDYGMISMQKVSAWSIDTTVDGDQTDIDAYISDQAQLGTIPPPGSEFIHSKGIERKYNGNQHASSHSSDLFSWNLSCIAAGTQIPVSYFGTHMSGGQTRASALVATEPVAKKMEKRREVIKRILRDLWKYCMECGGLPAVDVNVIFPELITQDRSQKLKDIQTCQQSRWIKPERAATLAAKEMGIQNYNYAEELKDMKAEFPDIPMPLVDPALIGTGSVPAQGTGDEPPPETAGMTGQDKAEIKKNDGY